MDRRTRPPMIGAVRDQDGIKRYALVKRSAPADKPGIKRYSLARVGVSPRSALGQDRHERLEQIAEAEHERAGRNGSDPAAGSGDEPPVTGGDQPSLS